MKLYLGVMTVLMFIFLANNLYQIGRSKTTNSKVMDHVLGLVLHSIFIVWGLGLLGGL